MNIRSVGMRIALLSALCSCAGSAVAADESSSQAPPNPKAFVELAAQDGLTEVQAGGVALKSSRNPQVREFAQRMIDDHGQALMELTGIGQQHNLIVAKRLDPAHTAIVQELSMKSGTEFDAAYARAMQVAHANAIALFKREAKAKEPLLAAFAKKMLPILTEHKRMADHLDTNIRATSASDQSLASFRSLQAYFSARIHFTSACKS